jgi:mRNA guanylyltransferase
MSDDLFRDLWQKRDVHRQGPLIPSSHLIQDPRKQYFIKSEISRHYQFHHVRAHNPVCNPVSLERKDLETLRNHRYMLAEKTDGVRFLLLLTRYPKHLGHQPIAVMINRKDEMFEVRVMAEEDHFQGGSLFDGELVWEATGNHNGPRQIYLVFDLIAVGGVSKIRETFQRRYDLLFTLFDCGVKDVIHDPRTWLDLAQKLVEDEHKIVSEGNQYCLMFRPKNMYAQHLLDTVWRMKSSLKHKSDGLIFTPLDEVVKTGTQYNLFKWKSQHTIDLKWTARVITRGTFDYNLLYEDHDESVSGKHCGIRVGDSIVPMVFVPNEYSAKVTAWHTSRGDTSFSHIVECVCKLPSHQNEDDTMMECSIVKIRHDKSRPNQQTTIERTIHNIQENITVKELLDVCINSVV